jgi:hypothetical protein
MNQKLFTVENSFHLEGRNGTIISGELEPNAHQFKVGNFVALVKSDGSKLTVQIAGIELIRKFTPNRKTGILIQKLTKEDVPVGTEVFLEL